MEKLNNGHIFMYNATIKALNSTVINMEKPNWRLVFDQRTQLKSWAFYDTNKDTIEPACKNIFF